MSWAKTSPTYLTDIAKIKMPIWKQKEQFLPVQEPTPQSTPTMYALLAVVTLVSPPVKSTFCIECHLLVISPGVLIGYWSSQRSWCHSQAFRKYQGSSANNTSVLHRWLNHHVRHLGYQDTIIRKFVRSIVLFGPYSQWNSRMSYSGRTL